MHIVHLSLTNFRNYSRLELDLPQHIVILRGENAQGKTNLLEAIYLLATSKSPRAVTERELINWLVLGEEWWVARLAAKAQQEVRRFEVEIALRGGREQSGHVRKSIMVNGLSCRAADLVGQIRVVMFSAQDIELIGGAPPSRRRYLDVANSQVDREYLRTLQRYQRVLEQRNHLLRSIRDHQAQSNQLDFWDRKLVENGSQLVVARHRLVEALSYSALGAHQELTSAKENLKIVYHPSIGGEALVDDSHPGGVASLFQGALSRFRERELVLGMTLVGPHRDEIRFLVDGVDVGVYGSRGQQRTVALSLKLAEARFMVEQVGGHPILLLDDILSELDSQRRQGVLESLAAYQQVLITTTDLDRFQPGFLSEANLLELKNGSVWRPE